MSWDSSYYMFAVSIVRSQRFGCQICEAQRFKCQQCKFLLARYHCHTHTCAPPGWLDPSSRPARHTNTPWFAYVYAQRTSLVR